MSPMNVVWHEGANNPDNRCWLGMTKLLNDALDAANESFIHRSTWVELPPDATEAIVVIHGDHEYRHIHTIQEELKRLQRALIIVIGDESALFPTAALAGPGRILWHQVPIPGRHDYCKRFLIGGYPPDCPHLICPGNERHYDWFFAGQITHARRVACAEQLRQLPNGKLLETAGFWQGFERAEYYALMSTAKIIPCPSGPTTPDSFRVAEALEAGCIPIVDGTCPRFAYPQGYWKYVFGYDPPFPIIYDWKTLPRVMDEMLAGWPRNRDIAYAWWQQYKKEMHSWVTEDLNLLRSGQC